ncbi:hypothetical protein BN946_scf184741.g2 [Trametes cinnabarina]|uniref:Zn(2)-C6 fungal-type domain-containing protein n=1 Tax=Pycnoporus cinnabarinus TaxID=5643 RepID=A0A060SVC2_PYCCI|nr:hypothetical protein BN946_scf184741.g2 [Trametes cinnabarina]
MSTAHLSLDDFAFPSHRPQSAYELSYALGQPQSQSLYPHGHHMEISPLASQASRHHHALSTSDSAHPLYLPEHPEAYLNQYSSGMSYPYLDSHLPAYAMTHRPASPRAVYTATSAWGAPESYAQAPFEAAGPSSSSFLHNLQNVIDSSHTSQVQQSINQAAAAASPPGPPHPVSSSWTLSGSLRPRHGHLPAHAPSILVYCSGDHPACQRCISRGLKCEYAPERKMRGPNKNKRKSVVSQRSEKSSEDERRSSITSITSTISSSSDASAMEGADAAAMASAAASASAATRPSSSAGVHPASPVPTEAPRARSTTVSVAALQHAAEYTASSNAVDEQHTSGPPGARQRPPPLNLFDSRQFYSEMMEQYAGGGDAYSADGSTSPHHTPLPSYLAESYSRIAHSRPESGSDGAFHEPSVFLAPSAMSTSAESSDMARAHISSYAPDANAYLQGSPTDATSVYSNPRSNSSDVSAPITPLSLSSDGMHDSTREFTFEDYAAAFDAAGSGAHAVDAEHSIGGMQAFEGMEDPFRPKSAPDALGGGPQWDVVMDDETPRAEDTERKLSHAGQLVVQAQRKDASSSS